MKLLVTGATGFVGRHVVAAAVDAGHTVRALVRPAGGVTALGPYATSSMVEIARADLRSPVGLTDAASGVDAVIHLAAAKEGDFATQFAGTVVATENLLAAMAEAGVGCLVGVSTFSVYDFLGLDPGQLLTEAAPVDETPAKRDEYARTKLLQEKLYRRFGRSPSNTVVIVRPGMIYGRDNLWHALLGAEIGPRFVRIGSRATLPLTYVENCARALVLAAEVLEAEPETVDGEVVNIVDDDLPTQADYAAAVEAAMATPPTVYVPWPIMRVAAATIERANELLVDGRAKFPGVVVPDRLHARFKPLTYTNAKAKRLLGWKPDLDVATAIERSVADPDPVFGSMASEPGDG